MSKSHTRPTFKQERTRIYGSEDHKPYEERRKRQGIQMCEECGSAYKDGRWSWDPVPLEATLTVCPACMRIRDQYPAGIVSIFGGFYHEHKDEIHHLIRNIAQVEGEEHPMERLMEIKEPGWVSAAEGVGGTVLEPAVITTTGMHLARRIGEALQNTFEGDLQIDHRPETYVRVDWTRSEGSYRGP